MENGVAVSDPPLKNENLPDAVTSDTTTFEADGSIARKESCKCLLDSGTTTSLVKI